MIIGMRKIIFVLYFISFCFISNSRILSKDEMCKDISYYFSVLEHKNPDFDDLFAPYELDSIKCDMFDRCNVPLTVNDFNRLLLKLNQYTDGHTQISDFVLEETRVNEYGIIPDSLIDYDELYKCDTFITVNGCQINELVTEIDSTFSKEYHPLLKQLKMKNRLPLFLSAFYNIHPPYCIEKVNIQNNTLKMDTLKRLHGSVNKHSLYYGFEFYEKDSIAVLFYNSCNLKNVKIMFERDLLLGFEEMENKKIKYLFIDVRLNGGGSEFFNNIVFGCLKSSRFDGSSIFKMNVRELNKAYLNELDELNKRFYSRNYFIMAVNKIKKKLILKSRNNQILKLLSTGMIRNSHKFKANDKGFDGLVFLIQGRETYSAAASFVENFKQRQMGIIVGEVGGCPVDYSGNMFVDKLPNSKISFTYSTTKSWFVAPKTQTVDGFISPDIYYDVYDRILDVDDYRNIIELNKN